MVFAVSEMEQSPGTGSDRYELRKRIAAGPISTVYEGWDCAIRRRVAVKEVPLAENGWEHLARFRREAQAAGRLQHPQIVGIFDYYETSSCAYIVMEFVEGATLKAILDRKRRMPLSEVIRFMEDVLAGLQYSHNQGVIHRDLKPSNIMITHEGRAKIADFGIARVEDSSITQIGAVMGTPAYMSPEQFRGQVIDASTDIYSAGVILYELLTGTRPFEGGIATIMHKALNTSPRRPSEISEAIPRLLDSVVLRAMAKRPQHRFGRADEFAQALRKALAPGKDELVSQPKLPRSSQPALFAKKPFRGAYVIAGGFMALVAMVGATAAYRQFMPHTGPAGKQNAQTATVPALSDASTASPSDEQTGPGDRGGRADSANASATEQKRAPDLNDAPASSTSAAPEQPPSTLPATLPVDLPPSPPQLSADPGTGLSVPPSAPLPAPPRVTPPAGPVATLEASPTEWETQRPLPRRRLEAVPPVAPHVPAKGSLPSSPGARPPAEAGPSNPASGRPSDHGPGNGGEVPKEAAKTAPASAAQESAPLPRRSFGRYEIVNGRRTFVPEPSADLKPQADVGSLGPAPVATGRPDKAAGEDRQANRGAEMMKPPSADQTGNPPSPKAIGRYETVNGRRVYIPAE